ncbi:membrane protein containing Sulphatase-modifying factor domain protein [Candidatus Magnetomorum sp. HK-1]|nr:membrane protein containing Sulphatase-modifying factor domain protein [Candidatus Magnetomorum sp. HK-1]
MQTLALHTLPFDLFLADLEKRGFTITPDHHIRLQTIVTHFQIPDIKHLDDLKLTLCPLFATNETQQALFYEAFDHFFSVLKTKAATPQIEKLPETKIPDAPETKKWPYWLAGVIVLCISIFIVQHYLPEIKTPQEIAAPIKVPGIGSESPIGLLESPRTVTQTTEQPVALTTVSQDQQPKKIPENIAPKPFDWRIPRYALLIALALGILLSELYRFNQRKMVLQKQKKKKPPLSWPIKVPFQKTAYLTHARFYTIAKRFRNRLISDMLRLDIPLTIDRSLESGGFPILQYSEMTCQPEYLFLIDLPHFRNHYSGYATQIADALSNENIFVKRFHYMDNPQICFETIDSKRLFLDDLYRKFPDHRLIVVGTGDDFLHPLTGKPEPWIDTFHQWSTRALLTPRPISEWGMNELTLNAHFPLFPCTMDGLDHLSLWVDLHEKPSNRPFAPDPKPLFLPDDIDADALEAITDDPVLFQWICACAVYPELHWNLTVYVGTKIQQQQVIEAQVLRLLQLPWFQKAEIPDPWRRVLIQKLSEANKEATHEAIVDLLEQNPPPLQSAAMDLYRLNLSIQQWMHKPKDPERRKKVQQIVFDESRLAKDNIILRMLDAAPKSPLDIILPARLRKRFFRHALSLFGLKSGIRLMIAICLSLLLVLMAVIPDLPRLLHPDDPSVPPSFVLQTDTIKKGDDVTLIAANATAQKKMTLDVKWDDHPLPSILPDDSNDFQWTFNPFDMAIPPAALTPGHHQMIAGFTESAWSEPLTIQVLTTRAPPEPKPVSTIRSPEQIPEKGRLYITAIPDTARIAIQHMKQAYTPGMPLNAGTYVISVTQDNYVPQTRQIRMTAGKDTRETITLEPFGSLTVQPAPDDSRVRIMNIKPVYQDAMALAPGRYSVVVSKEGFVTYGKWVTLRSGENKVMPVSLESELIVPEKEKETMLAAKEKKETMLAAKEKKKIKVWTEPLTGMEFVWVPKGCFMMGSPENEVDRDSDETLHKVCVDGFWMGRYEVTVKQYSIFVSKTQYKSNYKNDFFCKGFTTPDFSQEDNHPVACISWHDAKAFGDWLSENTKASYQFRLPTEAEWEYACRAGTQTPFYFGENINPDIVNYDGNYPYRNAKKGLYREKTMPVGNFPANVFGLFDMHGNVWEWCMDWYGDYSDISVTNPGGPSSGSDRVKRGGSWNSSAQYCRSAQRHYNSPGSRHSSIGLRLSRTP